jgi:hypothetical protein
MADNFIDQNGVEDFVDQNGVTLFIDQNGDFLGLGGVDAPPVTGDSDIIYVVFVI